MPLGLYLHLPFCRVHCTYCPFAITTDLAWQERYVAALLREIAAAPREEVASIYFGGGTPSRTDPVHLEAIAAALRAQFEIDPGAEISLEANPEDVTEEAIAAWRALGVNRLSIGVQSFDDGELRAIGRIHDRSRALSAVRAGVASGIRTSLDLIAGLPGQTPESFDRTLNTAIALGAGHLSLYMLDLEERTPLQVQVERGRTRIPGDETTAGLYTLAVDRLQSAGLEQYEVSNFARSGEQSRHNLRYWERGEYLGFGMAAHSFRGEERYANRRDIRGYIETSPDARDFAERLGAEEVRRERIFLSLRRSRGMCYEEFHRLCGQEGQRWIERGIEHGWVREHEGRVALTTAGFLQSNELISQLF